MLIEPSLYRALAPSQSQNNVNDGISAEFHQYMTQYDDNCCGFNARQSVGIRNNTKVLHKPRCIGKSVQ